MSALSQAGAIDCDGPTGGMTLDCRTSGTFPVGEKIFAGDDDEPSADDREDEYEPWYEVLSVSPAVTPEEIKAAQGKDQAVSLGSSFRPGREVANCGQAGISRIERGEGGRPVLSELDR